MGAANTAVFASKLQSFAPVLASYADRILPPPFPMKTRLPAVASTPLVGPALVYGSLSHTTLRETGSHAFNRPLTPRRSYGLSLPGSTLAPMVMPRLKPPAGGAAAPGAGPAIVKYA